MKLQNRLQEIENEFAYEAITKSELIDFMVGLRNGCYTFGSTVCLGDVKMNKRGNPLVNECVQKLSKWGFGTNSSYSTKVNNERERQGLEKDFIAQPTWYEGLTQDTKCAVGKHVSKDQYYLSLYPNRDSVSFVEYYINGEKATPFQLEQIKTFMVDSGLGISKSQGLDEDSGIMIRRPKIESIKFIVADGRKLKIVE